MSRIEYESENGYKGVLYGKSSMSIYDKDGNERLHTGFRNVNTLEELKEVVESAQKTMDLIAKTFEKNSRVGDEE